MGVKTENQQQSLNISAATQELDIKAVLVYILGTILQIEVITLVSVGIEKLVNLIDKNSSFRS